MLRPCAERSPNLNFSRGQREHGQEPNVFASKFDAYSGPPSRQEAREVADARQLRKQIQNQRKNARLKIEAAATKAKAREVADARQLRKQIQNQRKNARLKTKAAATKAKAREAAATRQLRTQIRNQRKNARLKTKAADMMEMPAAGGRRAMIL